MGQRNAVGHALALTPNCCRVSVASTTAPRKFARTHASTPNRRRGEGRAQLAFGVNVLAVAIGLPLAWNAVVSTKLRAQESRRAERLAAEAARAAAEGLSPAERHAVHTIVNDRRRERGLPAIVYDNREAAAAGKALAAADVVRRQMAAQGALK